mgnify:CR=1 FL=1
MAGIEKFLDEMEQEATTIRANCFRLSWFMRGGATYEQVLLMSSQERELIDDLAKENIETTNKTRLPWF